uniref:Uncharacterized protein n=1 Tax=Strongyloides venezuelensis TaxID=75913 RepID=A0A0K0G349_STRVS
MDTSILEGCGSNKKNLKNATSRIRLAQSHRNFNSQYGPTLKIYRKDTLSFSASMDLLSLSPPKPVTKAFMNLYWPIEIVEYDG